MAWVRSASVTVGFLIMFWLTVSALAPVAHQNLTKPERLWDTAADTWAATDALGRTLPNYEQVGPPRKDRFVGLFYFLWLGSFKGEGPFDVTQILQKDPLAMLKPESPLWGGLGVPHHWGESLFGYYRSDDEYVLRKHAQMLSDAGVDVIIFDVSNDETYKSVYTKLFQVFSQIRSEGGRTPQVAFLCPFWEPGKVVRELYHDLYGPGLFKDLWFKWKGKPLILADPDLSGEHSKLSELQTPWVLDAKGTLGQSFTAARPFDAAGIRLMTYDNPDTAFTLTLYRGGPNGRRVASQRFEKIANYQWVPIRLKRPLPAGDYYLEMSEPKGKLGWWSVRGGSGFGGQIYVNRRREDGGLGLFLNTLTDSGGKLKDFFTFRAPQPSYFAGPTKPDMWSWLEVYPQHVFRSSDGKKEQMSIGVAQNAVGDRLGSLSEVGAHGRSWHNGANDESPGAIDRGLNFQEQADRVLKEDPEFVFITGWNEWIMGRFAEFNGIKLPVMFVDEYNEEFSRDIEPMMGGHGDDYYYQLVSFIRRYKGVRPPPTAGPAKTIDLAGSFDQWTDVKPEYRDDVNDAAHRDSPAWNSAVRYVNSSGRNDFVKMKVARDGENLYFYAETKDAITSYADPHWMMLFLNLGPLSGPSWSGYQYVLNRLPASPEELVLEQSTGGWNWKPVAKVRYRVSGNQMQLAIRRSDLGLSDQGKPIDLQFKWMDNMQNEGDINDFYLYGDAAPNGRFNYRYLQSQGIR